MAKTPSALSWSSRHATTREDEKRQAKGPSRIPGILVTLVVAAIATGLGRLAPVVGAPVFAILGGIAIASVRPLSSSFRPGLTFSSRTVLQASIVVLGTGLSFREVLSTGASSLPVLLGSLAAALIGARILGSFLGVDGDLKTLVGVGTGICGASAIAATNAVIDASEADVSYAIATIFTFNVAAVLTFPSLGHLMHLSPHGFGLWAGTAINDLSSVVAASSIFGHGATSTAVVVKLTRTLMIVPITLTLSLLRARREMNEQQPHLRTRRLPPLRRLVPLFMGWFLVAVAVNTVGWIPHSWHSSLSQIAQVCITIALGAIGLSTRFRDIRRTGLRPLALGAMLWVLVAVTALALQHATGAANL